MVGDDVVIPADKTITFNQLDTAASVGGITIDAGGKLIIDASSSNRTLILNGNLTVNGTLTMRGGATKDATIKFDNASAVEYGLIVGATGFLDVLGTSKTDQSCIITALNADNNAYIYLGPD